jgi:hypothetical protein
LTMHSALGSKHVGSVLMNLGMPQTASSRH